MRSDWKDWAGGRKACGRSPIFAVAIATLSLFADVFGWVWSIREAKLQPGLQGAISCIRILDGNSLDNVHAGAHRPRRRSWTGTTQGLAMLGQERLVPRTRSWHQRVRQGCANFGIGTLVPRWTMLV